MGREVVNAQGRKSDAELNVLSVFTKPPETVVAPTMAIEELRKSTVTLPGVKLSVLASANSIITSLIPFG